MLKVNGKAYDWGDVDLKIPGLNIQVQEISYDDELEIEEVYGSGSKPRGYGTGNYKASGKLSMLRDDYDDLLAYCKQKGVPFYKMELPSIIVSYANEGARTKIDELKKVKFSKRSNKAAQGGKLYRVGITVPVDDESEKEFSYYFKRPTVPSYDRYIKTAAQGITKASKAFMLDAVIDEDAERLTKDMEENPGIAISIGNKLTEILGLTGTANLKKL